MQAITIEYLDAHERQIRTVGQMSKYIWPITGRNPEDDQEVNDLLQDMIDGAVIPLAYQGIGRGKTAYLVLDDRLRVDEAGKITRVRHGVKTYLSPQDAVRVLARYRKEFRPQVLDAAIERFRQEG